jgi:hypothetical protein
MGWVAISWKWALTPFLLSIGAASFARAQPPYPDVWHVEVADAPKGPHAYTYVALLSDDEVLVIAKSDTSARSAQVVMKTFFHQRSIDVARTNLATGVVIYADGVTANVVRASAPSITLRDGGRLHNVSTVYRRCYRGPARDHVVRRSPDASRIYRVFFYLLEEPEIFENETEDNNLGTGSLCPTEKPTRLRVPVVSTPCSFLELPDGTVLCTITDRAFVQRLRPDLTTPAKSMNPKLFGFPTVAGDSLFVGKLTGKNYGSSEEGNERFQEALDDLRAHLISLRSSFEP